MAYVPYVYLKRADSSHKINSHRKHSHITPVTRRAVHLICGFLLGLLIAYTFVARRAHKICLAEMRLNEPSDENSRRVKGSNSGDESWRGGSSSSLLFVGVMTAQKYLETRAVAVYETWGKEIPGSIAFFSSASSTLSANSSYLPLVRLKNVDDSYPPQKKSFMMLQYMWEHFGNEYEWFLRADDDVYIRSNKIEGFLRSINSSKPHFIGQAGRGNQEEFGLLSLEYDENFCMGGPGIILSRETLKRVAPHVKYCLQNLYSTHEDVELGRCVQKFARIPCTWSYEMQSIFYHNFSGNSAFTGNLKTKEVHRAITLHPIKHHQHMYRVHNYMQGLKIHELQQRKISLYRDLRLMEELSRASAAPDFTQFEAAISLENGMNDNELLKKATLFGAPPGINKYRPRQEDDVFSWDLISRSVFSDKNLNPRRKIESHLKEGLDDVIREVMDNINLFSRERGRVIEFQQILYGYYRVNPLYGPDYILDVLLTFKKYRGRKMTVPVRRHAYIQQQFAGLEIREVFENGDSTTYFSDLKSMSDGKRNEHVSVNTQLIANTTNLFHVGHTKKINFVLPLFGRHEAFVRFLKTYEEVCLRQNENVALIIVLFITKGDQLTNQMFNIVSQLKTQHRNSEIKIIPMTDTFSRAKALNHGMAAVDLHDLMFFVDVDMVWTTETLQRIRLNTVAGKTVYFPIVFSEFDPTVTYRRKMSPNHFLINNESGYWRIFGFGIMSVYKTDIQKVGGFNASIIGWGKEDVDLFEKFISIPSNISIFRGVDPNLVHIFHIVDCDSSLDIARLTMCRNTRSETYGSVNQLANLAYKHREQIFQYALAKIPLASKPNR